MIPGAPGVTSLAATVSSSGNAPGPTWSILFRVYPSAPSVHRTAELPQTCLVIPVNETLALGWLGRLDELEHARRDHPGLARGHWYVELEGPRLTALMSYSEEIDALFERQREALAHNNGVKLISSTNQIKASLAMKKWGELTKKIEPESVNKVQWTQSSSLIVRFVSPPEQESYVELAASFELAAGWLLAGKTRKTKSGKALALTFDGKMSQSTVSNLLGLLHASGLPG